MNKENLQMRISDIENKISSIEAEMAHLDLEVEASKIESEKLSKQEQKELFFDELAFLKQELADAMSEFTKKKRFKRQICLNNVDFLLDKQNKKLGELEIASGNHPGYLSRMRSGKSSSDPSIEFLMTAAEELNVPLELLVRADLTQLSATEEFLIKFVNKLIEDTQTDELVWKRETLAELERLEITKDKVGNSHVKHPLYCVEEQRTDADYQEVPAYCSLFFPNCGVRPCGDGYNAYLPGTNNSSIYIIECEKQDDKILCSSVTFYEIYMVTQIRENRNKTKKICNTLEMSSSIVPIVDSLVKNIIMYLNRIHLEQDVKNEIEDYIKSSNITRNEMTN